RILSGNRYRHGAPWAHVDPYALCRPAFFIMISRLTLLQQEEQRLLQKEMEDPLAFFMYALRAPETRRQWPRRLKTFLDFIEMEGVSSLEEQARLFIVKSRQLPHWAQDSLIRFMNVQG
ncbi:MAG: hypothetical protein WAQ29_03680, partial [Nitrososphaeraceae archaeon]